MNSRLTLPILLLATVCAVPGAPAKPSSTAAAKAGALAAQIRTPAVRAAMQCRVAFADTTASVPVKGRADTAGAGLFWSAYLKKLRGIDVAGCPGDFRTAFDKHLGTVKSVVDSFNSPRARLDPNPTKNSNANYATRPHFDPAVPVAGDIKGHHDALGDCAETYKAVFTVANRSMKTAPADDGQLASQIDALLKD